MRSILFWIIICCLSFPNTGNSFDGKIPAGYRLPDKADYTQEDQLRYKSNLPFEVAADFDGNGKNDTAVLLIKKDNSGWELFVYMRDSNDETDILSLAKANSKLPILTMGISLLDPGKIKTACGKGYWDCKPGEPPELNLENPGIQYFRFESASSVFYWDAGLGQFNRIWLSD